MTWFTVFDIQHLWQQIIIVSREIMPERIGWNLQGVNVPSEVLPYFLQPKSLERIEKSLSQQ
jgi:hypothetical protein